jgi:SecD/SecF fusion protein
MSLPRWKLVTYLLIILAGIVVAAPNFVPASQLAAWPDWLPKQHVTLGLDIKGGSHLVLEVDAAALEREHVDVLLERVRGALRDAGITGYSASKTADAVLVRVDDPARRTDAERVLRAMISSISLSVFTEPQSDLDIDRLDDGTIRLRPTSAAATARRSAAVAQSLEIVRKRIDGHGVAEPTIQQLGPGRILVQLPGVQDPAPIREALKATAKLTFHRVLATPSDGRLPPGYGLLPSASGDGVHAIERRPMLQGDRLADANAGFDQRTGQPVVMFRLDNAGAKRFAEITRAEVGNPFAIVLDGRVLSAPVIQEPITGGSGQISGNFTVAETASRAALQRAGARPV